MQTLPSSHCALVVHPAHTPAPLQVPPAHAVPDVAGGNEQLAMVVPALLHTSVVQLFPSLHWLAFAQRVQVPLQQLFAPPHEVPLATAGRLQ